MHSTLRQKTLIRQALITLSLFSWMSAMPVMVEVHQAAASASQPSTLDDQISELEVKTFGHASPSESVDTRLVAMEDSLFGKDRSKTPEGLFQRLNRIKSELEKRQPTVTGVPTAGVLPTMDSSPSSASSTNAPQSGLPAENFKDEKSTPAPAPVKVGPLESARVAFSNKDYKAAHNLVEKYIQTSPHDSNAYYLLGAVSLAEKDTAPTTDQYAYDQFLKGYYLNPTDSNCLYSLNFVAQYENDYAKFDPRLTTCAIRLFSNPNVVLNAGVNLFRRGHDAEALDLFEFVSKYAPGCTAGGMFNRAALAEKQGNLQEALRLYEAAGKSMHERMSLLQAGVLSPDQADQLTEDTLKSAIDHVKDKIATHRKTWDGEDITPGAYLCERTLIWTLSSNTGREHLELFPRVDPQFRAQQNAHRGRFGGRVRPSYQNQFLPGVGGPARRGGTGWSAGG
jgi:tetratricopeptide (TPR) repeat protein